MAVVARLTFLPGLSSSRMAFTSLMACLAMASQTWHLMYLTSDLTALAVGLAPGPPNCPWAVAVQMSTANSSSRRCRLGMLIHCTGLPDCPTADWTQVRRADSQKERELQS